MLPEDFTGGAADGDGGGSALNLELNELGELLVVYGAVCMHGSDDGDTGTGGQGSRGSNNLTLMGAQRRVM